MCVMLPLLVCLYISMCLYVCMSLCRTPEARSQKGAAASAVTRIEGEIATTRAGIERTQADLEAVSATENTSKEQVGVCVCVCV